MINERPGVPIETRLQPDDEVVVIERNDSHHGVVQGKRTPRFLVEYAVADSEMVAFIDVDRVDGELTEDRSWIRTRVTARVGDVLKSGYRASAKGQTIQVVVDDGGELRMEKCLVKAGTPPKMEVHRTYLLFSQSRETPGEFFVSGEVPLLVRDARVFNPWRKEKKFAGDPLDGKKIDWVIREVRRAVKMPEIK